MKKVTNNILNLSLAAILATTVSCTNDENVLNEDNSLQLKKQEDTAPTQLMTCGQNAAGKKIYRFTDIVPGGNDINKTQVHKTSGIDDRTCHADYHQKNVTLADGSRKFVGVYKIAAGTQNQSGDSTQPRIERASKTVTGSKKGTFVQIEGYVTIKSVGHQSGHRFNNDQLDMRNTQGTYIIQAKGTHHNKTIGSPDPAILLLVAKPKFKSSGGVDYFKVYREQITKRGGSGTDGRKLLFVADVQPNTRTKILMKNYFKEDNEQWVKVTVGSTSKFLKVPNTKVRIDGRDRFQVGNQAKIRFGAYRVQGGTAEIYWDTMKQTYKQN